MTIPKSLEAKFAAAGEAKRAAAARVPKEAEGARGDTMGRRAMRREAREAAKAAEAIWSWLDSEDARGLLALGRRHDVRVMLSGGIPPAARHAIALGEEPGTLWVLALAPVGSRSGAVRSPQELVGLVGPEVILSLAQALASGEIFDRIACAV